MIQIALGAAVGALLGLALHFLLTPGIGGQCTILCRPERATLASLLLGGLVAFIHVRATKAKTGDGQEAGKEADNGQEPG